MKVEDLELDRIDNMHIFNAPDLVVGKKKYKCNIAIHFTQNETQLKITSEVIVNKICLYDYDTNDDFCKDVMESIKSKSKKTKEHIMELIKLSDSLLEMVGEMVKKEHNISIPINPQNMAEA